MICWFIQIRCVEVGICEKIRTGEHLEVAKAFQDCVRYESIFMRGDAKFLLSGESAAASSFLFFESMTAFFRGHKKIARAFPRAFSIDSMSICSAA